MNFGCYWYMSANGSGSLHAWIDQITPAAIYVLYCPADLDNGSGFGSAYTAKDGAVTIDDLLYFLARFEGGC